MVAFSGRGLLPVKRSVVAVAGVAAAGMVIVAGCSQSSPRQIDWSRERFGLSAHTRMIPANQPIPKGGGTAKIGQPYQVASRWYVPRDEPSYDRIGIASWYGPDFHGRITANGEWFDMHALSAAHPTLPLPSYIEVTNLHNNRTLLVRVNNRGPFVHNRMIDLSRGTADTLGFQLFGTAEVRVRYAGPAPLDGNDRREQAYLRQQPWFGTISGAQNVSQRTVRSFPGGIRPSGLGAAESFDGVFDIAKPRPPAWIAERLGEQLGGR